MGQDEEKKEEEAEEWPETSLSFRFCHIVVNRNLLAFVLAFLAQTTFPVITAILYFSHSDVLPIDFTDIPLLLFNEPSYRRAVAWHVRNRDINEPMMMDPSFLNDTEVQQQVIYRQYTADFIELFYDIDQGNDQDGENILTEPYLRRIANFEKSLVKLPHYDKFCVLKKLSECSPVDSLIQYFPFLSADRSDQPENSTSTGHKDRNEQIWWTIKQMYSDPDLKSVLENYLGLNPQLDTYPPRSTKLRSIFRVSWVNYEPQIPIFKPGEGPVSYREPLEQSKGPKIPYNTKAYAEEVLSPTFWSYCLHGLPDQPGDSGDSEETKPSIRFSYYNLFLYYDRLRYQCWDDELYAFGSLAFIAIFLWFQTRSLFLACFGMYFILTNFVGGNLLYRYVFDYRYFGVFNALAIFLVLAVGVDEIFVFEEAWSATGERTYPSLAHRLYDCFRKCSLSIFVPTLATTIALVQTALCPLMALSSFGTFAACVVVLNYISIVSYFPCVLLFYHTRIDSTCQRRRRLIGRPISARNPHSMGRAQRLSQKACNVYCTLLWKPGVQAMCLILTAVGLGFLIYSATKLSIDRDPPKLYTETHPLGAALKRKQRDFTAPSNYRESQNVQMHLVWGIKDWDRSRCHRNEWKSCVGSIVWDDHFDLNPFPAQLDLLNICRRLKNLSKRERDDLRIKTKKGTDEPEMSCFMDDMDNYFHQEMRSLLFEEHKRLGGLPSTQVKVEALMLHVPQIYNMTQLLQNPFFYRYFEIANLYWLNDGYKFLFPRIPFSALTFKKHALLVGHSLNISDLKNVRFGSHSFVYGTKLRYAAIVVNTTIPRQGLRYDDGLATFDKWESFFNELKSGIQSPNLRQSGFVIAPDSTGDFSSGVWHWLVVQKVLITSAWQGVLIGVGLALPILILFTDDFLVGTLTTFTIACTSISIIGVIPLAGWKLGLLESLNLTLVADLAIDHIVHVAEGYQLSKKRTRKEKVEELLHEAGISIVSGALTTVGASVFLLFAKIVFFMQFGLFILFTVAFSVVYSLGMFVVLLTLIGPEDDRYSMSKWFRRMKIKAKKTALKYLIDDKDCDKLHLVKCGEGAAADHSQGDQPPENGQQRRSSSAIGRYIQNTQLVATDPKGPLSLSLDGPKSIFVTASSSTLKSIDDDNISSGYESTSAAMTRLDKSFSSKSTRIEEIDSPSSSTSDDRSGSNVAWPIEDQPKIHGRQSRASVTSVRRSGSRAVSAHASRGISTKSASRKIVPIHRGEISRLKSKSVAEIVASRVVHLISDSL